MKTDKTNFASAVPSGDLPPARAKPAVTPWFPGSVTPWRIGVYERKYGTFSGETGFSLWDGANWRFRGFSVNQAAAQKDFTINPHREWRGLASNPARKS